jgi:hypothetical protein
MNMYTEFDKELVKKFLIRNYPVTRYKHKGQFKRSIIMDNGDIFLLGGGDKTHERLKYKLLGVLKVIFDFDELILIAILDNFLPTKSRG